MKINLFALIVVAVFMNGCASSGVSWSKLQKENADDSYCARAFVDASQVKSCDVEFIALDRAKNECQKDTNPDYCVLMAKYGWDNFKRNILTAQATKEHAQRYPIMCGWKEKQIRPCSSISN